MKKLEDYNIVCDNFNNMLEFCQKFYKNSKNLNSNIIYNIAVCNHGHIFYNEYSSLATRPYNVNIIKSTGCDLLDGFKLCFIEIDQINSAKNLIKNIRDNKLYSVIKVVEELIHMEYKIDLEEIEQYSNKIPSQINSTDISINLYKHNTSRLNKLGVWSIEQTKNKIVTDLFEKYPIWNPTYENAKKYIDYNGKYYIANIKYNANNLDLIKNDNNIAGIICNTSSEDGMKWATENIKHILPGTGSEI